MAGSVLLIMLAGEQRRCTIEALRDRCVSVRTARDAAEVLVASGLPSCDALALSLDLAEPDPLGACSRLSATRGARVLAIGDRAGRIDAVQALRAGAADFVPHTTGPAELAARLRALLRRMTEYAPPPELPLSLVDVLIDSERHEVTVRGLAVELTRTEFDLLHELARGAGELVPREELLRRVWGVREGMATRSLDVHMGRLRKKIERDPSRPELIVTVPHIGYRMAA